MQKKTIVSSVIGFLAVGVLLAASGHEFLGDEPLLGQSPDAVIQRLGVPDSVSAGSCALEFSYTRSGETPKLADFRVVFHEGRAVFVTEQRSAALGAAPVKGRVYPGQSLEAALKVLGPAKSASLGMQSLRLSFEDRDVMVAHGRVVGISKKAR